MFECWWSYFLVIFCLLIWLCVFLMNKFDNVWVMLYICDRGLWLFLNVFWIIVFKWLIFEIVFRVFWEFCWCVYILDLVMCLLDLEYFYKFFVEFFCLLNYCVVWFGFYFVVIFYLCVVFLLRFIVFCLFILLV